MTRLEDSLVGDVVDVDNLKYKVVSITDKTESRIDVPIEVGQIKLYELMPLYYSVSGYKWFYKNDHLRDCAYFSELLKKHGTFGKFCDWLRTIEVKENN